MPFVDGLVEKLLNLQAPGVPHLILGLCTRGKHTYIIYIYNLSLSSLSVTAIVWCLGAHFIDIDDARFWPYPREEGPQFTLFPSLLTCADMQELDGVEFFAGCHILTRCVRSHGYKFAAMDQQFWKHYKNSRRRLQKKMPRTNFFNLLTAGGFISAIIAILSCQPGHFLAVFAITCSTWVSMSKGSTGRTFLAPRGLLTAPSVKAANVLASRPGVNSGPEASTKNIVENRVLFCFVLSCQASTAPICC